MDSESKASPSKNSVMETVNPGYLERKEQKRVDSAKKKAAVRSNEATVAEMSKKKKPCKALSILHQESPERKHKPFETRELNQ